MESKKQVYITLSKGWKCTAFWGSAAREIDNITTEYSINNWKAVWKLCCA